MYSIVIESRGAVGVIAEYSIPKICMESQHVGGTKKSGHQKSHESTRGGRDYGRDARRQRGAIFPRWLSIRLCPCRTVRYLSRGIFPQQSRSSFLPPGFSASPFFRFRATSMCHFHFLDGSLHPNPMFLMPTLDISSLPCITHLNAISRPVVLESLRSLWQRDIARTATPLYRDEGDAFR